METRRGIFSWLASAGVLASTSILSASSVKANGELTWPDRTAPSEFMPGTTAMFFGSVPAGWKLLHRVPLLTDGTHTDPGHTHGATYVEGMYYSSANTWQTISHCKVIGLMCEKL